MYNKEYKKEKVVESYCTVHGVWLEKTIHMPEPTRAHLLDFMARVDEEVENDLLAIQMAR